MFWALLRKTMKIFERNTDVVGNNKIIEPALTVGRKKYTIVNRALINKIICVFRDNIVLGLFKKLKMVIIDEMIKNGK